MKLNSRKCLVCGLTLDQEASGNYHGKCQSYLFGNKQVLELDIEPKDLMRLGIEMLQAHEAITGVQAKISAELVKQGAKNRLTIIGAGQWSSFIIKPQSTIYSSLPECEHLTMMLAKELDLPTVPNGLIELKNGELAYITRRIDRVRGEKIHQEDFCQLLEKQTNDKYRASHERIAKRMGELKMPIIDFEAYFQLTLFCFLTGNADMHLKNFSVVHATPFPRLCPAYDLVNTAILNPADTEELALTLAAKKRKLNRSHFEQLAEACHLTPRQTQNAFRRLLTGMQAKLEPVVQRSFLSQELKESYVALVHERLARMAA